MATSDSTDQRNAAKDATSKDAEDEAHDDHGGRQRGEHGARDTRDAPSNGRVRPAVAIRNAREQLSALLGREPESVSALSRAEHGWSALVDVLELARIPDSTSVLATYAVDLDEQGDLIGYERRRRYTRGQIDRC